MRDLMSRLHLKKIRDMTKQGREILFYSGHIYFSLLLSHASEVTPLLTPKLASQIIGCTCNHSENDQIRIFKKN